ncbi:MULTISPECIES: DUF4118 domain-containing protein [Asticcacaulis]|uniref:DUF4118 domain-containing protein n=1 Tax=Asticcacaulis TaxID=76890 RepID=UPI001AE315F8|nr:MULTISPECIES: DUF4118 domain-containing protein [Asticcacaulis]MBP2160336.1 K+-sensing histidine kinase KdpD [Asticcacaulis solisilvae]MDR6801361.1 K+-sensing histidine kinase KdpD [Asticcacaulis sp. BE141]
MMSGASSFPWLVIRRCAAVTGMVGVCTLLGVPLRQMDMAATVPLIYLVGVVVTAAGQGLVPAVSASLLGVLAYNLVFVPPYFSFTAYDSRSYFTLVLMLAASLVVGSLTARVARHAREARENADEAHALYELTRGLWALSRPADVAAEAQSRLAAVYGPSLKVWRADEPGEMDGMITEARLADGDLPPRTVNDRLIIIMAAGKEVMGVLTIAAGISAARQARLTACAELVASALRRAAEGEHARQAGIDAENERLRSTLLASVSHDLRTPLAVLKGGLGQMLRNRKKLPRDTVEDITGLLRHLDGLQHFVENLLRLAALTSGRMRLKREPYLIQEIIGAALQKALVAGRNVRTVVSGTLPLVNIDGALIEQVLVNLIDNAVRHTPEDGVITVAAERHDGGVRVRVTDSGPGFPDGMDVFGAFEAGQRSDRAGKTSGLGLAICKGVVEAHGGTIAAETFKDPSGAAIQFTLPVGGE